MDISNQLIKNSYNYVLQSDLATGVIYRIGGQVPFNPIFQSGLTIFDSFRYSNGSEQNGYTLVCDGSGNTTWQPFSGYSVSSLTTGVGLSANTNIGNITLINTLPDQVVSLSNGQYIAVSGTYPNFTISTTGITDNDKFISGFTYNNNTFTLVDNSGTTLSATINSVTGLTINGNLIVTGNTNLNSISAATIGTSANCVNDIYVTNIHSCSPLNINPLNEGNVYFGSTSAVTIDLSNNRVGIGTVSPAQQLHIVSSNARVRLESSATNIWDLVSNIGGGSNNDFVVQASGTRGAIYLGAYSNTNTVSVLSNGALVVNSPGNSSFTGTGNVGIGTASPTSRLQVRGLGSTSSSTAFRVENSASTVSMVITDGGNTGLGVVPTVRLDIQGTTATDGGQLGAELLSSANWTSTDWTGDYTNGFTHITGNTSVLSNTLAAVIGTYYQISYTITGRTAGSVTIAFGGQSLASITATGAFGPLATTTGNLTITPTSDFNGTIVISIRAITAGTALINLRNSSGTVVSEVRTSTSNSNTFIGVNSGTRITTGISNVGLGRAALQQNTTGVGNTAIGLNTIGLNTIGNSNTAVGSSALFSNTTASSNTAVGSSALNANTTGGSNVAVGNSALLLNVTGSSNVAIGVSALRNTTTGSLTAVGTTALQNNTTGTGNVAFGSSALNANTTGTSNTAVGNSALLLNTTGGSNIGIGQLSLSTIVSGSSNVAIGVSALRNTTTSSQTAVGASSLQNNTTGSGNSAFGSTSLFSNTIGAQNTAIGSFTLQNNTTASNNTAIGYAALFSLTGGSSNTALGNNAGRYILGGTINLTNSSNSVFIGNTTQALADSQTNQIVIGNNAIGLGSNTTVLGNSSTTLFRPFGNVAIGIDSASASLHVNNSNTGTTTALFSGTGQNILRVVGSGSTQPIFTVQGSSGELFSVTDSLIGSLYSVNDITGLPVLEVFSDNTILMGSYQAPSLNSSTKVLATTGTTNIYSIPTSAYTGAFFDYTVSDGTNLRAGNIMSIWSGTSVNITEVQTTSFGSTTGLTFNMVVSSGNAILRTSGVTGNWTVKTIVRSI